MAEILITKMEMLPEGFAYDVRIRGNGDVTDRITGNVMGKAQGIPPHGNLIERDEAWDRIHDICIRCIERGEDKNNACIWCKIKDAKDAINGTQTVIPRSDEK